jgi:protease-4
MFFSFFSLALAGGGGNPPGTSTGFGDAVAIVRVEGVISAGDAENIPSGATSGTVIADLERAATDPTVKAIVLRVDSPGGTVTGSAQIYDELLEMDKPIVVSMASTAASGGYYVSAPAEYIFARPDTVTGSIGVIYTIINAEELLADLGVEVTTITSGPNKDFGSLWSELTPEQREILESLVDESYAEFVRIVATGRGLSEEEVRALSDGRIYSGRQALAIGLVDELGDLEAAIAKAAALGGISGQPRVVEYEHAPTLDQLFAGFASRLGMGQADEILTTVQALSTPALEYRYVGSGLP